MVKRIFGKERFAATLALIRAYAPVVLVDVQLHGISGFSSGGERAQFASQDSRGDENVAFADRQASQRASES